MISRLLDANRQQISNPTGISGTIYAVLDVQSNDETWTEIGLTLESEAMGRQTVTPLCRGTGSTSADVAVGPGLAAAGQVEIECVLKTNDVLGECVGMQLDPKYANGAYELSAFLTTDEGATREVVASQPIALNNHGFVRIAHVPGSEFELGNHTKGLTFYGGPAVEGNVNSFHACPVAYDGTEVGAMSLQTVQTDTEQNPVVPGETTRGPTFIRFRFDDTFPVLNREDGPFTWSIITDWWSGNHAYYSGSGATENIPGDTETWIVNGGIITNPDGLDVSATFRAGGEEAKYGPLHFDYRAPVTSDEDSKIAISRLDGGALIWETTREEYYNDGSGSNPMRLWITDMVERGVGHVYGGTSAIAVGDCSVRGNADRSGGTAFAPLEGLDNVTHINQLPEEDPVRNGVADGGGIDCYVAEAQALADRLGNAVVMGEVPRIRTATTFGVDRTAPVVSRMRPSEALVLNGNSLFFEVEDPQFETREESSGINKPDRAVIVRAGATRGSGVYWTTTATVDQEGEVEINIDPASGRDIWGNNYFAREIEHTVYATVADNAGNYSSWAPFTFTRDQKSPTLALSAVPSSFGLTQAASVSVTVAGTLSDATEIRRAFLSIHDGTTCTEENPLESSQVSGPVRRLHNGTSKIEFSEVFTIKKADDVGPTDYCFYLRSEDDARDADGVANPSRYDEVVGTFSVQWPAGPQAPPTHELVFTDADDEALTMLEVNEGSTATYKVALSEEPSADVTVAITVAEANREVYADLDMDELTFTSENYSDPQEVTVTTLSHDANATEEMFTLSHDASDGGYDIADADLSGMVNDDEVALMASLMSLGENDDTTAVTVSVSTGVADPDPGDGSNTDRTITVTLGGSDPDAVNGTDFGVLAADKETAISGTFDIVLAQGETMKDTMIYIVPTDDPTEEDDEAIPVTGSMTGGS